jgi:Fe-S cluster biogenesis protein NfuA
MKENIEKALQKIQPAPRDGGDIELVDIVMGVKVRMTGACGGCPCLK